MIKETHVKPPYNTLIVTQETASEGSTALLKYEINCCEVKNGEWYDISEKDFDDREIKTVILTYKNLWTEEIKTMYKEHNYKKLVRASKNPTNNKPPLSRNEIENILNSLL